MTPTKTVPSNTDAEAAVLGSVLIDQRCISEVAPILKPSDFYLAKHREVYAAMLALHQNRSAIDPVTLPDQLEKVGKLKLVGGDAAIAELIQVVPSAIDVLNYARIVHQASVRRGMLDAASALAKLAYDEGTELEEALHQAEAATYALRRDETGGHFLHISQAVGEVYDEFQEIQAGTRPAAPPTGYSDIDRYLTGWRRQELTIIAARPGIGKTSLLLGFALLSAKAGHGTLIFSAEMSYRMLVQRMLQAAGIENLPGASKRVDWSAIADGMGQLSELPLWIDDTPNISVMDIRARALRLASERRIDHIFIDYVQLVKSGTARRERYLEIGDITKTMKQLARELDNHVVAASQLNRQAEETLPTLRDLKESGAQEEDADNVLFIHRGREIPLGKDVVEAEIIIAKQRNGPTGKLSLGWMPKRVTFVPLHKGVN
jgi:replicative DNA helicase